MQKWRFPKIRGTLLKGLYRGYIRIMEKKMDTTIEGSGLGFTKMRGTILGAPKGVIGGFIGDIYGLGSRVSQN